MKLIRNIFAHFAQKWVENTPLSDEQVYELLREDRRLEELRHRPERQLIAALEKERDELAYKLDRTLAALEECARDECKVRMERDELLIQTSPFYRLEVGQVVRAIRIVVSDTGMLWAQPGETGVIVPGIGKWVRWLSGVTCRVHDGDVEVATAWEAK